MFVKIQLLRDDGTVITEHIQDAFEAGGWGSRPAHGPVIDESGCRLLQGFCYLPVPPPRDREDLAEFRRLYAKAFGAYPYPTSL